MRDYSIKLFKSGYFPQSCNNFNVTTLEKQNGAKTYTCATSPE